MCCEWCWLCIGVEGRAYLEVGVGEVMSSDPGSWRTVDMTKQPPTETLKQRRSGRRRAITSSYFQPFATYQQTQHLQARLLYVHLHRLHSTYHSAACTPSEGTALLLLASKKVACASNPTYHPLPARQQRYHLRRPLCPRAFPAHQNSNHTHPKVRITLHTSYVYPTRARLERRQTCNSNELYKVYSTAWPQPPLQTWHGQDGNSAFRAHQTLPHPPHLPNAVSTMTTTPSCCKQTTPHPPSPSPCPQKLPQTPTTESGKNVAGFHQYSVFPPRSSSASSPGYPPPKTSSHACSYRKTGQGIALDYFGIGRKQTTGLLCRAWCGRCARPTRSLLIKTWSSV